MGEEQVRQLADATMTALRKADLSEEISLLEERVFSRRAEELFELEGAAADGAWELKPMLELLLLHLQEVATNEIRPDEERRREIRWALDAAGF